MAEPVMSLGVLGDTGLWQRGPSPYFGETRLDAVLEGGFEVFIGGKPQLGDLGDCGLRTGLFAGEVLPAMVPQNPQTTHRYGPGTLFTGSPQKVRNSSPRGITCC